MGFIFVSNPNAFNIYIRILHFPSLQIKSLMRRRAYLSHRYIYLDYLRTRVRARFDSDCSYLSYTIPTNEQSILHSPPGIPTNILTLSRMDYPVIWYAAIVKSLRALNRARNTKPVSLHLNLFKARNTGTLDAQNDRKRLTRNFSE